MSVRYLPVPGTWGEKQQGLQWFQLGSPLEAFLETQGLLNICAAAETPYGWSTNLDFEHGDHSDWEAGVDLQTLRRFIDIAGPVRSDMMHVYQSARPNIRRWLHVYCPGWKDRMQLLGELFSGGLPRRQHPLADGNVGVPHVGHSGLLYDASYFPLWRSAGLIDFLRDAPAAAAAV